jgi:transcription elongation factor GreA-like protein
VSSYIIVNLLKKNEKLEDNVLAYEEYLKSLNSFISASNEKIKQLDEKGIFEADDEVGYFLRMLKNIQEQLNKFRTDGNN